jgi:hypothetical protein
MSLWHWLIDPDRGLAAKIAAGVAFFLLLGLWDLIKNGRQAKRWREYAYLLCCVAAAMAYGLINDQVTITISWEYFYYGKELEKVLGPVTPPDMAALRWQAVLVGLSATWWTGVVLGVAVLIANNPRKTRPQLSYRRLYAMLAIPLIAAAICAGTLGLAGWLGAFPRTFVESLCPQQLRPSHFMGVYGAHLGGYAGAVIGLVLVVVRILRVRKRLTSPQARGANEPGA